jgi:site-specific DNA recombinase
MTTATRFAFYGRVSTDDAQDPSLSIPRQLAACKRAIEPAAGEVVASYWDVESGRTWLDKRGRGNGDGLGVAVPREGGLADLLDAAANGHAFDAVIVESIDRLSRMTADATQVERELERRDIGLFAADEPLAANATAILTRRVKQGVAEWYVRDLVEKSRRGMEQSVLQGWHTGGPVPYGYRLKDHPHPNPHKARDGKKKHRLVPDSVRAPIVLQVFEDYCLRGFGLGEICDKLNGELERYPPPKRNRKDEMPLRPTWSRSQIWAMLRNPKYTGYNVWGRHDKRRGRPFMRPRQQWVWSPTPTHEPLVPKELFDLVEERAQRHERRAKRPPQRYRQRDGRRHGRLYILRGRVRCALCERRMEGAYQKGSKWYRCRFSTTRGRVAAEVAGHPRALQIKEDVILDELLDFMSRRIFGPERLRLLRDDLAKTIDDDWRDQDAHRHRLERELEELDRALYRQALRLEEHDDPDHPVVALAKRRILELSTRRKVTSEAIAALDAQRPDGARPAEIEALLAAVPDLRPALRSTSEAVLADILERFDVEAVYDKPNRILELAATVTPELIPDSKTRPPSGRSGNSGEISIAGAGFEPATFGL